MEKPHYLGHRKRLRERFRQTGFEGFAGYEALELLLTYAIPRQDVKPVAKRLIERFGSVRGALDAPFAELSEVEGLSETSATFLHVVKECSALYLRERMKDGDAASTTLPSTAAALAYCELKMSGLRDEQFRVLFLNAQNQIIADEVLNEGTVNESVVYPRKVMERALHNKATALILVHNHPSGRCAPSDQDRVLTAAIIKTARDLGITVHDHLIIGKSDYYSFLERGEMRTLAQTRLLAADTTNPRRDDPPPRGRGRK
jgi:DNA repair protein RadC